MSQSTFQEILDAAYLNFKENKHVAIFNLHPSGKKNSKITVEELHQKNLHRSNGKPLSHALAVPLRKHLPSEYRTDILTRNHGAAGNHTAIIVTRDENTKYIVDYTAKQYDEALPAILVLAKEEWENLIDLHILKEN